MEKRKVSQINEIISSILHHIFIPLETFSTNFSVILWSNNEDNIQIKALKTSSRTMHQKQTSSFNFIAELMWNLFLR